MIHHLDHLVLTTAHEKECIDFYTRVLGMKLESFIGGTPPVERKAFKSLLERGDWAIECQKLAHYEGPVIRTGASSKINSVYVRDPYQNLIEISELL